MLKRSTIKSLTSPPPRQRYCKGAQPGSSKRAEQACPSSHLSRVSSHQHRFAGQKREASSVERRAPLQQNQQQGTAAANPPSAPARRHVLAASAGDILPETELRAHSQNNSLIDVRRQVCHRWQSRRSSLVRHLSPAISGSCS